MVRQLFEYIFARRKKCGHFPDACFILQVSTNKNTRDATNMDNKSKSLSDQFDELIKKKRNEFEALKKIVEAIDKAGSASTDMKVEKPMTNKSKKRKK